MIGVVLIEVVLIEVGVMIGVVLIEVGVMIRVVLIEVGVMIGVLWTKVRVIFGVFWIELRMVIRVLWTEVVWTSKVGVMINIVRIWITPFSLWPSLTSITNCIHQSYPIEATEHVGYIILIEAHRMTSKRVNYLGSSPLFLSLHRVVFGIGAVKSRIYRRYDPLVVNLKAAFSIVQYSDTIACRFNSAHLMHASTSRAALGTHRTRAASDQRMICTAHMRIYIYAIRAHESDNSRDIIAPHTYTSSS